LQVQEYEREPVEAQAQAQALVQRVWLPRVSALALALALVQWALRLQAALACHRS